MKIPKPSVWKDRTMLERRKYIQNYSPSSSAEDETLDKFGN